jgi:hypothetical protein
MGRSNVQPERIEEGWIEHVFSVGFAFGMTADAWRCDLAGLVPLREHAKALIMQTTLRDEASCDAGLQAASRRP